MEMRKTLLTILLAISLLAIPAQGAFVTFRGDMLFIGDSIAKGLVAANGTSGGALTEDLRDVYMSHYTNPASPTIMGTPTVITNLAAYLGVREFEQIVLEIGAHNLRGDLDPTTSGQYQTDIGTIMTSLIVEVGSSANIFAMNIPQVDEAVSGWTNFNTDAVAYNTALDTVCAGQSPAVPVFDLRTITDPSTGPYEGQRDPDGIHYTSAGYNSIASDFDTWIRAQ